LECGQNISPDSKKEGIGVSREHTRFMTYLHESDHPVRFGIVDVKENFGKRHAQLRHTEGGGDRSRPV
jgi:hypothetical protein